MKNWLEYDFSNSTIRPTLILIVYINRNIIMENIDKEMITLKEDMINDTNILTDCFNIIINNVLAMFTRSYTHYENFKEFNNELNITITNINNDIIDKYLLTSININNELLFKTVSDIHRHIEHIMLKRSSKVNIYNITNMYDLNESEDIHKGSYIYSVDNDIMKIMVFDNV